MTTSPWPADGERGAASFFCFHPAGHCRVAWRGTGPDGALRLDAPDLCVGFAVGGMSRHQLAPNAVGLALRRSGPLFVASCRAFAFAFGPAVGAEAERCAGLGLPAPVLRACYGRLARLAERILDDGAAVDALRGWMGSDEFLDDVRHFGGRA